MALGTNRSAAIRQDKSNAATQQPNISVGLPGNLHVTQCDQYRAPRMRTRENRPYISRRDFSVQRKSVDYQKRCYDVVHDNFYNVVST